MTDADLDRVREALETVRAFVLSQPNPDRAAGDAAGRLGVWWGQDDKWHIDRDPDELMPWPLLDGETSRRNWGTRRDRRLRRRAAEWQTEHPPLSDW